MREGMEQIQQDLWVKVVE